MIFYGNNELNIENGVQSFDKCINVILLLFDTITNNLYTRNNGKEDELLAVTDCFWSVENSLTTHLTRKIIFYVVVYKCRILLLIKAG